MSIEIPFTKMHGLGNCYVYIDLVSQLIDIPSYSDLAVKAADAHTGIGSDGLILIVPSNRADIMMRIFNKDGSEGKNCGNGLRCVAKYAYEHGLVNRKSFKIETLSGVVDAEVHLKDGQVDLVTIDMGKPVLDRKRIPMKGGDQEKVIDEPISFNDQTFNITAVSMGNPHGLFFVEKIDEAPIHELGPFLADHHPAFPEGLNVGFIEKIANDAIEYRVWERGSGMTQACGTGACAAVAASVLTGRLSMDETNTVHLAGGDLYIKWLSDSQHVLMTGGATTICKGIFYL
ncbi:diaminopimelate epimerase [Scopulibacillus daqui]|uniref:Diaminopimelate epimerase n=1 Tax=Scopulibacillus daqui TaxID=1469162 RepID=A0ABS2Q2K7_9BACL|nr:diaminopimelate epimerase [Scopulibacillus daqui]MBM7646080.1 diaminopimelate epimerase [Scopulibacillus daqui]